MYIIQKSKNKYGYPALQTWSGDQPPAGYYEYPEEFYDVFYQENKRAAGFVTLTVEGEKVVNAEWDEETYQAWCEANPEQPEPEPELIVEERVTNIENAIERGFAL